MHFAAVLLLLRAACACAAGPATVVVIGDVMLGWGLNEPIRNRVDPFRGVRPVLKGADLALANLEGPITVRGTAAKAKRFTFRTPPSRVAMLSRAGLDGFGLANNHIMDFGEAGLADTLASLAKGGLCAAGAGRDAVAARRAAWFSAGGIPVALLSYSEVMPPRFRATGGRPGAAWAGEEQMVADVREARALGAQVVVMLHWGLDQTGVLEPHQRRVASALARAGAAVIAGSHPHVAQGVERIGGTVVAYSLGDGVFGGNSHRKDDSLVLRARLGKRGVESVELLALNSDRTESGSVASIRTGSRATRSLGRVKRLSRAMGTVLADGKTAEGWPCLRIDTGRGYPPEGRTSTRRGEKR